MIKSETETIENIFPEGETNKDGKERPGGILSAVSLGSFIAGVFLLILGIVLILSTIRFIGPYGAGIDAAKTPQVIVGLCACIGCLGIATSVISGLIVARHRPVVLWWIVPLIFVIGFIWGIVVGLFINCK